MSMNGLAVSNSMSSSSGKAPMQLRPLAPGEEDYARNVAGAVLYASGNMAVEVPDDLKKLPGTYRERGGEFWIVSIKGAVVGTVGVRPEGEAGQWMIRQLALVPMWRGMGIGRMLADAAVHHARKAGAERLRIRLQPDQRAAYGLFNSLRFKLLDRIDPDAPTGPFTMERVLVSADDDLPDVS